MDEFAADIAIFSCSLWRRSGRDGLAIARQSLERAEAAGDPSAIDCWRLVLTQLEARASGGPCPLRLNCRTHDCPL
ncbi:hypothetical protein [Azospirillum sp. TSO22-1]|uniref:hypothetical protein n=1 Tax=Azospirillum sp. TSO22-1 TaxID=716789 RepID=UPI000D6121D0|nr:hypothetical protein [Azospirillum sp. TSO22-1]PWC44312.1 hypothetical protein TSO221_18005 [Azospirillum sp. TSO22-1]